MVRGENARQNFIIWTFKSHQLCNVEITAINYLRKLLVMRASRAYPLHYVFREFLFTKTLVSLFASTVCYHYVIMPSEVRGVSSAGWVLLSHSRWLLSSLLQRNHFLGHDERYKERMTMKTHECWRKRTPRYFTSQSNSTVAHVCTYQGAALLLVDLWGPDWNTRQSQHLNKTTFDKTDVRILQSDFLWWVSFSFWDCSSLKAESYPSITVWSLSLEKREHRCLSIPVVRQDFIVSPISDHEDR